VRIRLPSRRGLLLFFAVIGPGIITGSVDNDVGGITTYSIAGAHYGYQLIWTLIPAFVVLFITQEMNARMGIVTGKGLADLIRENMGVKTTFFIFIFLLAADIMNTTTEFSGVAGSMQIFGVSKYISVPIVAVILWFIVVNGNYRKTEKIFLAFSLCLLVYVVAALLGKPDWTSIGKAIAKPEIETNFTYISTVIALIGTTIAPWMQFYQQSSIVDKGIKVEDYGFEKVDVLVGSLFAVLVAAFIMIACAATMFQTGVRVEGAKDAALALGPLAGENATILFALGLLNASLFSAAILPLSTAYTVCEAFGWESSISHDWKDAPMFFGIYTALIVLGAAIILLPIKSLIDAMMISQTFNGVLLPVILVTMLTLINDKRIMGKYVNGKIFNILAWTTVIILILLAAILVVTTFLPGIIPG